MAKINVGEKMENFVFDTPYKRGMDLKTIVGGKKTGLLFSRYYGCSLCRYDMIQLKEQYDKITATGGQVVFVLQSDPDLLARNFTEKEGSSPIPNRKSIRLCPLIRRLRLKTPSMKRR